MNQDVRNKTNESPNRDVVAQVLYWIGLPLMIVWQIASTALAVKFAWVAKGDLIAPSWFSTFDRLLVSIGSTLSPAQQYDTKLYDAGSIAVSGIVMGVFLRRWAKPTARFEVFVVLILLLLGAAQLVTFFILPAPEEAFLSIPNGNRMVENLSLLLSRNSNVAFAVCGAALGISIPKKE